MRDVVTSGFLKKTRKTSQRYVLNARAHIGIHQESKIETNEMDSLTEDKQLSQPRKEVVEKITKWFQEQDYVVEKTVKDESYYHATVYKMTPAKQRTLPISVDIPKDSDKIKVSIVFGYKLLEKPSYFVSDANKSNRYTSTISNTLDALNIQWRIIAQVEDNEIEIMKTIYFDGLSKHVLFETICDVYAAYRASNITHKQLLETSD